MTKVKKNHLKDMMTAYWKQDEYAFGHMDFLFFPDSDLKKRITALLVARLQTVPVGTFDKIIILVPKSVADRMPSAEVVKNETIAFAKTSSISPNLEDVEFELLLISSLSVDLAMSSLPAMNARTLLYVAAASTFRKDGVIGLQLEGMKAPEDYWLPHLLAFGETLHVRIHLARASAIIDAFDSVMYRTSFLEKFNVIPGATLLIEQEQNGKTSLMEHVEEWNKLIIKGKLGEVIKSIENLPEVHENEKAFLRARFFHRAGLHAQAQLELENIKTNKNQSPIAYVILAQVAIEAGASEYARELLELALPYLNHPEALEIALDISSSLINSTLEERLLSKLETLIPRSPVAKKLRVNHAVTQGRYQQAYELLDENLKPGVFGKLYLLLNSHLNSDIKNPDYQALIGVLSQEEKWKEIASFLCAQDALRRGMLDAAYSLSKAGLPAEELSIVDVRLIINVVEKMLLIPQATDFVKEDSKSLLAMQTVLSYLSLHPEDTISRIRFERLISTEVSGQTGVAVLAYVIHLELKRPLELSQKTMTTPSISMRELMDDESEFLNNGMEWLESISPFALANLKLPNKLVPPNPDRFEYTFVEVIKTLSQHGETNDANSFHKFLALGVAVSAHMSNPNAAFNLIFMAAKSVAVAGKGQLARDLYESMLSTRDLTASQRRVAWLAMADVNCRMKNKPLALMALSCSSMVRAPIDAQDAYEQANTLSRVLRDLGLLQHARDVLKIEKQLLKYLGVYQQNSHRLDFAGLQIEMMDILSNRKNVGERTPELLKSIITNVKETQSRRDDVAPTFVLLANVIKFAQQQRIPVASEAHKLLAELFEKIEPSFRAPAEALIDKSLSTKKLLELHLRYENSRYSPDAANEPHGLTNAARKFISTDIQSLSSSDFAFAVELMSDRAMALPGWTIAPKPVPSISSVDETANFLSGISKEGFSIVVAALDDFGRMRRMTTSGGILGKIVEEDSTTFSIEHYSVWKKNFPFKFGVDDNKTINLFFNQMAELGMSALPDGRIIIAFEAALQQIPVNLLMVENCFAGKSRSISYVPSISWLAHARSTKMTTSDINVAWIPTSPSAGGTLDAMKGYLADTFQTNGITLVTHESLPKDFSGVKMAIVGAHGSLIPDHDSYFQRVSDEQSFVQMADDFANAFRNIGVVVLFVCSGGRADAHPDRQTTIGLARTLLDKGCRAVVASPWPLNSLVPPRWLPKFLDAWNSGEKLVDACFAANKEVLDKRGEDWADCLAMTVYGDPLLSVKD